MVVSSKSGGTIEPMSMYKAFSARVDGTHFVAVTDPGTSLEKLAAAASGASSTATPTSAAATAR